MTRILPAFCLAAAVLAACQPETTSVPITDDQPMVEQPVERAEPVNPAFQALDRVIYDAEPIAETLTQSRYETQRVVPFEEMTAQNETMDRQAYLAHLVKRVTEDATTAEARATRWTAWLQDHMFNPFTTPVDDQGNGLYDPIWLLKGQLGSAGQTNQLIVDGLKAVGDDARLVAINGHVLAEGYWNGDWRALDASRLHNGEHIRDTDGTIPSVREITANPDLIDSVMPMRERLKEGRVVQYSSLDLDAYKAAFIPRNGSHQIWMKTATDEQETASPFYGWNYRETIMLDASSDMIGRQ